jgi:hypothetical protein
MFYSSTRGHVKHMDEIMNIRILDLNEQSIMQSKIDHHQLVGLEHFLVVQHICHV